MDSQQWGLTGLALHPSFATNGFMYVAYDAKPGWKGWDEVHAHIAQAEMHDLIIELRSLTLGVGFFNWTFDHLQVLTGKLAEQVVTARAEALA